MLSKFVMFFALFVFSCSSVPGSEGSSAEGSLGKVKANIQLAPGVSITQVTYTLACTPTPVPSSIATGTWQVLTDVNGVPKVDGSIGGIDLSDTCTLVLSAQDSWGLDHGNIQNCRGEADGLPVDGTAIQMNLVCTDNNVAGPNSGNVTADITVLQGAPYQCSGIAWYSSDEYLSSIQYVGDVFNLNMAVTVPTSPQTVTWSSTNGGAYWYQGPTYTNVFTLTGNPATDPATFITGGAAQVMYCYTHGTFTITLTVQDLTPGLLINGQPGLCPAYSNTFQAICN